ncbi:flavin reductase family protein [Mycobacterium colombiense]|uniref:flavin reductase family protein n=1 Tax=Mycobacterium colombiense TaxID=339268 RepID=UPI0035578E09
MRDAVASFECTPEAVFEAGDHIGVMGRIVHLRYTDHHPLLFHRGTLARLHPATHRNACTSRLDWWSL